MRRIECYFYDEIHDMGASIPTCIYWHKLGHCPCDMNCPKFIKRSVVTEVVKSLVDTLESKQKTISECDHIDKDKHTEKDCSACIFGLHYTTMKGKPGLVQVCHGFDDGVFNNKKAAKRIDAEGPCEMFEEGARLMNEMNQWESRPIDFFSNRIPVEKRYIYDRRWYSETPTGRCTSYSQCGDRSGNYCYSKRGPKGCTSCMRLDGTAMAEPIRSEFTKRLIEAGLSEDYVKIILPDTLNVIGECLKDVDDETIANYLNACFREEYEENLRNIRDETTPE